MGTSTLTGNIERHASDDSQSDRLTEGLNSAPSSQYVDLTARVHNCRTGAAAKTASHEARLLQAKVTGRF